MTKRETSPVFGGYFEEAVCFAYRGANFLIVTL